MKEM
jgi:hypothetical protein